jgi:hypothetical protein
MFASSRHWRFSKWSEWLLDGIARDGTARSMLAKRYEGSAGGY